MTENLKSKSMPITYTAEALKDADTAILLMVLVQFTQDEALLHEAAPYINGPWDYMESLPVELKHKIRLQLSDVLNEYAKGSRPLPPVPDQDLLMKMMQTCVGQAVPPEYMPMLLAEMKFAHGNPRDIAWRKKPAESILHKFKVIIIGAGLSGLCAAIKLKEAGIPFIVYEKNAAVGGTWYENIYPGCAVDTPNHFYSYSFEPNHDWSHYFSKRDELWNYFENCADKYEVRNKIHFNTEVLSARFTEEMAEWSVTVREKGGVTRTDTANAVIFAVGQLNRPLIPPIPGLDKFKGPVEHTACWKPEQSVAGLRVAMIGTGASGVQVAPAIAPDVDHLTIFQRSPHWLAPSPNYHRSVAEGKKWALKHVPYYANWYRFQLLWASADGIYPTLRVDPDWQSPDRSLNQLNENTRQNLVKHIEKEVGDNPGLLKKVIPGYPPYGKRMLRDNKWYAMLKRDNVDLVTEKITRIDADSVVTEDGRAHDVDLIILATGFRAAKMLAPMEIVGRDGVSIRDVWGDEDPRAFLGITVPHFPNMFVLFGPNTVLAHGGSAIFHTECQVHYTLRCLRELIEGEFDTLECKQEVHDAYNTRVDNIHKQMVWAHEGVGSWYKNSRGRVVMTTPWRMVDYWNWTIDIDVQDYDWRRLESRTARPDL